MSKHVRASWAMSRGRRACVPLARARHTCREADDRGAGGHTPPRDTRVETRAVCPCVCLRVSVGQWTVRSTDPDTHSFARAQRPARMLRTSVEAGGGVDVLAINVATENRTRERSSETRLAHAGARRRSPTATAVESFTAQRRPLTALACVPSALPMRAAAHQGPCPRTASPSAPARTCRSWRAPA